MIKIHDLKKNYRDFQLNITLEVPAGTVTGIVGKNGAGKSTTIKSILGLIHTDGGEVEVLGKRSDKLSGADKQQLGVALADSGFSFEFNVEDVAAILKKMYKEFDEENFRKQCKDQGLPFDKKLKDFSTGMKAKLRVLAAVSHKAKVLILDEPTSGLDVIARNEVLEILRAYLEEDPERSILISSHISSDLEGLCDDIYFIHDGEVVLHEDTDAILGKYGILKLSKEDYEKLDKQYILVAKEEKFGVTCLTAEKMYYMENYPGIVVENSNLDEMILLMLGKKN